MVNAPKYVAIILTAFAGASWLTAGIALVLGIIKTTELGAGPLAAVYVAGLVLDPDLGRRRRSRHHRPGRR